MERAEGSCLCSLPVPARLAFLSWSVAELLMTKLLKVQSVRFFFFLLPFFLKKKLDYFFFVFHSTGLA